MSSKAMLLVVIASMLMTLCASYTYIQETTFAASTCTTALGTIMNAPQDTCLPAGKTNNVLGYYKIECNTTHAFAKAYSDKTCATENTTRSAEYQGNAGALACTLDSSNAGVYQTFQCGQTTAASQSVAVVMRFDASGCADAAFEGFSFYELDTCTISGSTTQWQKWSCNGTTLEKMYYSDSTCTTNTSALPARTITGGGTCAVAGGSGGSGGSGGTTAAPGNTTTGAPTTAANTTAATTTADPNANTTTTAGGRRMHAMRRLQSSTYYKIYEACGNTKPTLPAGAGTVPSTAASSSGNMAGAQRFATVHSMAAALVAAVFVALS